MEKNQMTNWKEIENELFIRKDCVHWLGLGVGKGCKLDDFSAVSKQAFRVQCEKGCPNYKKKK